MVDDLLDGALELPDDSRLEIAEEPLSERLKPDHPSGLHAKLITHLQDMIQRGEDHIEKRSDDWERVDEHMRLFVNLERTARAGDKSDVYGDSGAIRENPFDRMICIPVSYTTVMTRMVQMFTIFTQVDPFIHLQPTEGGDRKGARIHELALGRDAQLSENPLQIWQMLYDGDRYGMSVWYDTWEEKWGWAWKQPRLPRKLAGILPEPLRHLTEKTREWKVLREWNNWVCIDPHNLVPDPNFPINRPQEMGFIGHWNIVNWLSLCERQLKDNAGPYFNVKKARELAGNQKRNRALGRASEGDYSDDSAGTKYPDVLVHELQWKIIPKDFGLGDEDKPVIFWFAVAEKELIIRAHPSVYEHNEFTYAIGAPDPDMHAPFTPGMGSQLVGSQDLVNWLVNSHVANIRKTVNDQLIYNPDLLNESDILSPGPARHIRLTKRGRQVHERQMMKIDDMYGQLRLTDVTAVHLNAAQAIIAQTQRMGSTPDTIQGMPLPTKRTLGEIEHLSSSATMRIGTTAELLDIQVVKPVAMRAVQNRQQLTSIALLERMSGRLAKQLEVSEEDLYRIKPEDLYGGYDYIPRTPTMIRDPARAAALWGSLLQILGGAPQLLMPDEMGRAIDPHKVLNEFLRVSGINYFEDFYKNLPQGMTPPPLNVGILDDEKIDQGVRRGNIIPAGVGGLPGVTH
jgi:hypothetical protein